MPDSRSDFVRRFSIASIPAQAKSQEPESLDKRERYIEQCDWCRRREVGIGIRPWMREVTVTTPDGTCQTWHIGPDCYIKWQRLISRLERRESPGAIR